MPQLVSLLPPHSGYEYDCGHSFAVFGRGTRILVRLHLLVVVYMDCSSMAGSVGVAVGVSAMLYL